MDERRLDGKVALVTGGGRGIGAATAARLAELGAKVVVTSRSEEELAQVVRFVVDRGHDAMAVVCDVTQPQQVERLFAEAQERYGPVDVLVNNAGAVVAEPLAELSDADWERMVAVNLTAPFLCARAALKQMLPRKTGVILNVASVAGLPGVAKLPGLTAYAATKGGVLQLSEALAAEVQDQGIRVVSVSPGAVDTKMLRDVVDADVADAAMSPGKVAHVIAFLASGAGSGVNQANVTVWGPPTASE
jgi:3-oxoacyl-[acyl-carrier protein] reductase